MQLITSKDPAVIITVSALNLSFVKNTFVGSVIILDVSFSVKPVSDPNSKYICSF